MAAKAPMVVVKVFMVYAAMRRDNVAIRDEEKRKDI